MKKILLTILIFVLYFSSNAQSPLRINKYLIDSLVSGVWHIYHDSLHNGSWGQLGSGSGGGGGNERFGVSGEDVTATANRVFNVADFDFTLNNPYTFKLVYGNSHYYFTGGENSTESYFQSNNNLFNTIYSQNADNTSAHIDYGTVGGSGNQFVSLQTTSSSQLFQVGNYINTGGFWVDQKQEMQNNHSNGGTYWYVHREKWTGSENFVSGIIQMDSLGVRMQTSKSTLPLAANYKGLLVDSISNIRFENYPDSRADGLTTKALYIGNSSGDVKYGTIDSTSTGYQTFLRGIKIIDSLTAALPNQTLASTSDATSHTVTLSNSGGSIQLVEGSNITLTTTGTGLNGIVTIAATGSGGAAWNDITDPTGDQALTFDAGESSTWTDNNTTEDLFTINNSTSTSSSLLSLNKTGTASISGGNIAEFVSSGANGMTAQTVTGLVVSVTNTNVTSGTNVGLNVTASGATTANYAALFSGRVGMGQTAPQSLLHVGSGATATGFGSGAQLTVSNGGSSAYLNVFGPSSTETFIGSESGNGIFGTLSNHPLLFRTNNTLRGQFTTAGTLLMSYGVVEKQGADVASVAGAITLGVDGNAFEITGTNAITLIANTNFQNGHIVTLLFTSTATLTDGTANSGSNIGMELAGNTNFVASAGATVTLRLMELGGTQRWYEVARSVQ